ncbi:MAG TPA: NAD(P)H-dependent oxidoreductase [Rhodanobacter sp.]|nr:NAD(P)H-dependent oxidoreductase [Rhodanobacter sp.]
MEKHGKHAPMVLRAFGMNCTLKRGPEESSTQKLLDQVLHALTPYDVVTSSVRIADHDVKPSVSADEGDGDEWPMLRNQVIDATILVLAAPIWMSMS